MTVETSRPAALSSRHGHAHCLLCGDRNPRSLGLSFVPGPGTSVEAALAPDAALQGYHGILHGGVICALLDAAMTHCLFHLGVRALTADLHVRFVRPASAGAGVRVRAWMVGRRGPLHHLEAEVIQEGTRVAWGEARFLVPREKRNGEAATRSTP